MTDTYSTGPVLYNSPFMYTAELILILYYVLLEVPTTSSFQVPFGSEANEIRSFIIFSTNTVVGLRTSRTAWRSDMLD